MTLTATTSPARRHAPHRWARSPLLLLVGALLFRRFEKDITSRREDEEPT